ncbi:OmpP1/FadL family transporter [Thaumasiovibrio sp. DFM-14]|uniref:OmpP1/FadL family transporter n=1 Tax=Thaumasiovibrio sp. DFM-14 TaxID=3384792 RepID=UPI0039A03ED2
MNKKRLLSRAIITALAVSSTSAMAAGFQLNSQSATGLGRAFAGDAVIADNASVMARNPAAMALFSESSLSLGFNYIDTDVRVNNGHYQTTESCGFLCFETVDHNFSADGLGGGSLVPNVHYIHVINDKLAVGINAYSNFGTSVDFGDQLDDRIAGYGGKTAITSANIGTAISYRVNNQWSFGAGLDLIIGQGEINRDLGNLLGRVDVDADGIALGFNLGATYEMNDNHRFGLSYRYSPTVTATGDVSSPYGSADDIDLPLPDMVEFSGYHRLTNAFAAHYSVQWVGWSAFDTLNIAGLESEYKWRDAGHISVGGTYYMNDTWTLRAGYMYDMSAQDEVKSISIPDSNRHWASAGFTYRINSKSDIDFGLTYLIGQDVDVVENLPLHPEVTATTRADAVLVGLQYSRKF